MSNEKATAKFSRNYDSWKCEINIGEAVEQEENVFNEVKTARIITYLRNRMSEGGRCEAAVTARTRCW